MLDGTTPPACVLELVLPGSRKPVSGPSDKRMEEVRAPQPQQNLDVVFERVQNPTTLATPIQQQSSSSDSSCTSPPDHSQPAPLTARTASAVEALPTDPVTARNTSAVEAPRTARTTSAVAPPSANHNHNEHAKISIKKSGVPPSLRLHGLPTEDMPESMALFHSHISLHAPDGTPDSVIDHHAVRYLAYLVTGGAASTMNQIEYSVRYKCGRTKSTNRLASTHVKHMHADNQSNAETDLENTQQVPSVLAVPRGVGPAVEAASRVEKSSQRQNDTFSPSMVPQALYVSAASRKLNEKINLQVLLSCNANRETHFDAFHASAMSGYPRYPTALNSTSKRVRVNARVNDYPANNVTIDTATDVPCISVHFVQTHLTMKDTQILGVPPGAINLSSADGSPLKILGYVRFQLTLLGDITLPVEALVLPSLGPDIMLLDNTIMGAFGGVLDWSTEQVSFKTSQVTIKASHRRVDCTARPENTATARCSVVTVNTDVESVPVLLRHKCCIPPQSAMAVQVESATTPTETTAALIEPLIVTFEDIESPAVPEAFQNVIVARTVSHWSAADKTGVVQIANPSHQYVHLKRNTLLGHIAPESVALNKTTSAIQTDSKTTESTPNELRAALTRAFDKTTFTPAECKQVLTLCTKYRSVFPCHLKSWVNVP